MRTISAKPGSVERKWYVVDLEGQVVGRAASQVAAVLRGKHKPEFTPHVDTGDFVIAVNADKVVLTGRKLDSKTYQRHSGHPGGIRQVTARRLMETHPERVFLMAVKRMLPKSRLGQKLLSKLRVYRGPEHPHMAQQPQPLEVKS